MAQTEYPELIDAVNDLNGEAVAKLNQLITAAKEREVAAGIEFDPSETGGTALTVQERLEFHEQEMVNKSQGIPKWEAGRTYLAGSYVAGSGGLYRALQDNVDKEVTDSAYWVNMTRYNPNILINGGFDVWQEAVSYTCTNSITRVADMWVCGKGGSTLSIERLFPSEADRQAVGRLIGFSCVRAAQITCDAGNYFENRTEYRWELYDKDVTLSFASTFDQPLDVIGLIRTDAGFATTTTLSTEVVQADSGWYLHEATFTFPNAGSEFPSAVVEYSGVRIMPPALTAEVFTGVKLEYGAQRTPYAPVLYGDELNRCYRYYYSDFIDLVARGRNAYGEAMVLFPVRMCTTPVLSGVISQNGSVSNKTISATSGGMVVRAQFGDTTAERYGYSSWVADARL